MKNCLFKKITAILILCFVLFATLPLNMVNMVLAEESKVVASVVFGEENICGNISVKGELAVVSAGGKTGRKTLMASGADYEFFSLSQDFKSAVSGNTLAVNIPDNTPIDITVEYYDGKGCFAIGYDSWHPDDTGAFGTDNWCWSSTETVRLKNTKQWKTHTFHIEDMRMENRCSYASDFRLGVWDPYMGWSSDDVVFGSVTVKVGEYTSPLKAGSITSSRLGNIFSDSETIRLCQDFENKTDKTVEAEFLIEIFDSQQNSLYDNSVRRIFLPKSKGKIEYVVDNPRIYGIYTVLITEICYHKSSNQKIFKTIYNSEFSVAKFAENVSPNKRFGTVNQLVGLDIGNAEEIAQLMKNSGMGVLRDEIRWDAVETQKGVLKIPEDKLKELKNIAASGVKISLVLGFWNPFYDDGKTPYTDDGIRAYANYCAFVAKELNGVVESFEVWNEYNAIPQFNNGEQPPETYGEMIKVAYPAIKEANPDAFVWGLDSSGIDLEWSKRVFETGAYDYMDGVSVHDYSWNGIYKEDKLIEKAEKLKELMGQYGKIKPVYFSELGWSTFDQKTTVLPGWAYDFVETTKKQQAANVVVANALFEAFDMCDVWTQYCLYDKENNSDLESCWGLVNKWNDRTNVPNGAKPSYLSTSAFNCFAGESAEFQEVLADERCYAFKYYNEDLKKNVVIAVSCDGEKTKNYYLGASVADIYDLYGNKLKTIESKNGIYTFELNGTPFYVVGDFEDFADADKSSIGEINCTAYTENGDSGYNVTAKISKGVAADYVSAVCAAYSSDGQILCSVCEQLVTDPTPNDVVFKIKCGLDDVVFKIFLWDFDTLKSYADVFCEQNGETVQTTERQQYRCLKMLINEKRRCDV